MELQKCLCIFSIIIFSANSVLCKKLPTYIEYCHADDPNINECFKKGLEQVRPHMKDGIPEFALPSMNPLILPEATLDTGRTFKAGFKNIEISYLDEFIVGDLNVDLPKNHIDITLQLPRMRMKSVYNVDGSILVFQLKGTGSADGNYTNIEAKLTADGIRHSKEGQEYLKWEKVKFDLNIGKAVFRFDGLFTEVDLNEQTNKAINDNSKEILEELKPVIEETMSKFALGLIETMFDRFSLNELFPKK